MPVGSFPVFIKAADVNADGHLDLLTANSSIAASGVSVLRANGSGGFLQAQTIPVGKSVVSLAVADFDGDGKADIAVLDSDYSGIWLLHGDGAGSFTGGNINYGVGMYPTAILVAASTSDGTPDVASANTGSADVPLLLNRCARRAKGWSETVY